MGRRERKGSPVLPEYISASGREPGDLLCFRQLLGMPPLNERELFSQTCRICPAKEGLSRDRVFLRGKDALLAHIVIAVPARRGLSFPCPFSVSLPSAWTQTAAAYLSRSRPPGEGRQSPAFLTRRLLSTCLGMDCAAVQNQSRPPGEGRQSPRVSNEKIIKRPPRHELRSFAKPVMPARRGPCLCRASCGDGSRQ